MSRRRLTVVGILVAILIFAGPAFVIFADRGQAAFGDNELIGLNQLGAATVDVAVGPNTVGFDVAAMAPGDRFSGTLELENEGTLPVRYAIEAERAAGSEALLSVLEWRIWPASGGAACATSPVGTLFEGVMTSVDVTGSPAVGQDDGDRLIQPGDIDRLCVDVQLSIDTPNSFQGSAAVVELIVLAEQAPGELP